MKTLTESYDIVVCGGGLAGTCAAIAAARHGAKVCLVQDRPVLGGNSSSEIRVTPHGAANFHAYARETGIISEALIEERSQNHQEVFENGWTNSVWDTVLYDIAIRTPGLTLRVNTTVEGVIMADGSTGVNVPPDVQNGYAHRPACNTSSRIAAVTARVANAETLLRLEAAEFIDCTGDASLADWAGCEWRMGTESRAEFNEPHAPAEASTKTMGNSIHFRARDMGKPIPFKAPDWAVKHENPDFFYKQGRGLYDMRGGYWWIEIGMPWDTIYDAETIRHELTRHTLGIWDWIKNRDPKTKAASANYALDWIGQVPGKRESRRVIGQYFLTEHSIAKCEVFPDEIAFGGWFIDLHTPGGLLAPTAEPASAEGYNPNSEYAEKSYVGPYGIPLRCLHSKDIENLSMAGRNVSATHAALLIATIQLHRDRGCCVGLCRPISCSRGGRAFRRSRGASQGSRCSWRRLIHHPSGTRSKSPPHQTHGRAQCHSTASIREASSWPTPAARARRARRSFIEGYPGRGYGSRCRSPPDRPPGHAPASLRGADHEPAAGASGWRPAGRHRGRGGRLP
jgi:hypothetical protein